MEVVAFEMSPKPPTTDRDGWGSRRWGRAVHKPECGGGEVETCLENCEEP